jgi:RNA polymerase sigma-70 factor (ECF subfamily)
LRTNAAWVEALSAPGARRDEALTDLRDYLLRAVFVYLLDRTRRGAAAVDPATLAEDCVQDAMETIVAKLDQFEGRSKFTTWACRIVLNEAGARLRRHSWRDQSLDALSERGAGEPHLITVVDPTAEDPERSAVRQDLVATLEHVIAADLTERQRAVLVGVVFHDEPPEAVALKLTRNNVYKLLHDARCRIRDRLGDDGVTPQDMFDTFVPTARTGGPLRN